LTDLMKEYTNESEKGNPPTQTETTKTGPTAMSITISEDIGGTVTGQKNPKYGFPNRAQEVAQGTVEEMGEFPVVTSDLGGTEASSSRERTQTLTLRSETTHPSPDAGPSNSVPIPNGMKKPKAPRKHCRCSWPKFRVGCNCSNEAKKYRTYQGIKKQMLPADFDVSTVLKE